MAQLVSEIRAGIARSDSELVLRASSLLGPALEGWRVEAERSPSVAANGSALADETRRALNECEALLAQSLARTAHELRRLGQGRRLVASIRVRQSARTVRLLGEGVEG